MHRATLVYALVGAWALAQAARSDAGPAFCQFQVTNIQSFAPLPDPANSVIVIDLAACLGLPTGTPLTLTGVGWIVEIQAVGESSITDPQVHFVDHLGSTFPAGAVISIGMFNLPGNNNNEPIVVGFSPAPIELALLGQPNVSLPDGVLRMEFGEAVDHHPGADTLWLAGALFLAAVPGDAGCDRGDLNCDGAVSLDDVAPFVAALLDPSGTDAQALDAADADSDGTLDARDIQPFVECVMSGGCA